MRELGEDLLSDGLSKHGNLGNQLHASPDCMNACYILSNVQPSLIHPTVLRHCV